MLVDPKFTPVAKPVLLMVAAAVLLDAQVCAPNVAAVPSVILAVAEYCCVTPAVRLVDDGVMRMEPNTGAVTVKVVLEVNPFAEAVMVVGPCANVAATPLALMVATAVLLDVQVAGMLPVPPFE